jgi:hypothetical protein
MNLSLVLVYNDTEIIKTVSDIDLENTKSVLDFSITQRSLGEYYQATLKINVDFPYYEELLANPVLYGIKYTTDYVNLVFQFKGGDAIKTNKGVLEANLVSSSYRLNHTVNYPFSAYNGQLGTLLSYLNPDILFTPLTVATATTNVIIETGGKNDYEIMDEAIKYPSFFSWRDNGIVLSGGKYKTQILYGDFGKEIDNYYVSSSDPACKGLYTFQNNTDVINDLDVIQIDKIETHYDFNFTNRLFVYVDTGQGASLNSLIPVEPSNVSIKNGYDLFPVIKNGLTMYYIHNPFVLPNPVFEQIKTYSSSGNSIDENGNTIIDVTAVSNWAYQQGINYYRTQIQEQYDTIKEIGFKRFILPGNSINIDYKEVINRVNGSPIITNDIQATMILNNLNSFNTLKIQY